MNRDGSATDDDTTDDERERVAAHLERVLNYEDERANHIVESREDLADHRITCTSNGVKLDHQCKCSALENESSLEVWCKGDVCLAPYSLDGEYYQAVIDRIEKLNSIEQRNAVVTFIGFESEGSEFVPLGSLRKISRQRKQTQKAVVESENLPVDESFFTHLKGNEAEESLRSKYGKYEVESQRIQADMDSQQNRRKLDVTVHRKKKVNDSRSMKIKEACWQPWRGEVEEVDEESMEEVSTVTHTVLSRPLNSINGSKHNINESEGSNMMAGGFDDQDMERPSFAEPPPSPSIALLLSAPGQTPVFQIPATVNRYLRDYQRDGVRFLYQHYSENTGAILGDDMGLGKTVQIIAFISAILGKTGTKADIFCRFMERDFKLAGKAEHPKGAFLIVSPGTVMYNWKDELETWGYFKTGLFHASTKDVTLERASKGSLDVVLTTYETLRNHVNEMNRVTWLAVVMDEVHRLKDPKAKITVAAKALRVKRRYGLTGTPLQNRLEEFWCVLDWANPGCLGTAKSFELKYGKPIKRGQSFDVTKRELATGRQKSKELQEKLGKWFLRRNKDLLADQLPKKDEMVVFCPLMAFQEDVYQTLLQHPDVELVTKKNFPCDCGSGEDRGKCCHTRSSENEDIKKTTMRFFQLLLKVANHAALLAPTVKQTLDQQKKARDLCEKVFARYPEFTGVTEMSSFELLSDPKYCGKMKVLDKLLRVFQEGRRKALLFSRSTQLLNILEEYVISRGLVYRRLDGATKPAERISLVQEFNRDPGVFLCLVSTKAGGLGLNFTGANVVVIFDPTWNPANDLQAQDRAYRIGQRRDVRVYRLISSGTIEEMMYLRQVYKQQLANIAVGGTNERRYFTGVEGEKDKKGELFGIENLFSYRAEGASLSKDIVRRTEKLDAGYRVSEYELLPETKEEYDLEKMTRSSGKPSVVEDPYNLEEIASQFVDGDEIKQEAVCDSYSPQETQNYEFPDLKATAVEGSSEMITIRDQQCGEEIKGSHRELFGVKEPEEKEEFLSSFDAEESLLSEGGGEMSSNSENATNAELLQTSVEPSVNKRVSFELFSSSEEENALQRKNYTKIKKKRKAVHSDNALVDEHFSDESFHGGRKNRAKREPSITLSKRVLSGALSESAESFPTTSVCKGTSKVPRKRTASNVRFKDKVSALKREKAWSQRTKAVGTVTESDKVSKGERSKKDDDSVQGILEACGVHYTHVNRQVVGPSEAENHMSKRALQDVFELRQFSQQPANCFPALESSDESDDLGLTTQPEKPENTQQAEQTDADSGQEQSSTSNQRSKRVPNDVQVEEIGNLSIFIGSTPRAIRRQHFWQMVETLGFGSEVDFAKCVIESNVAGRREILKRYYVETNPVLAGLSCFCAAEDNCSRKELGELDETNGGEKGKKSKRKRGKRSLKTGAVKKCEGGNSISGKHFTERTRDVITEHKSLINENCFTGNVLTEREDIKSKRTTVMMKSTESSAKKVRNDGEDEHRNVAVHEEEKIGTRSTRCIDDKETQARLNKETERESKDPRAVSAQSNKNIQARVKQVKPLLSILDEFFSPDSTAEAKNGNQDGEGFENTEVEARTDEEQMSEAKINTNSVLDDFI